MSEISQRTPSEIDPKKPRAKFSWSRFGGKFLVISVLVHLIFLSGAGYLVVQSFIARHKPNFHPGPQAPNAVAKLVEHRVQLKKDANMSAPQMAKRITVANNLGRINLPEMPEMPTQTDDVKPMKMSGKEMGMGMGPGTGGGGGGPGGGGGSGFTLPKIMADRCSTEGRLKEIQENGGDPRSEAVIQTALRWLQKSQNSDGSWGSSYKGGHTGLALLAFLGHCEKPSSGEFGPTVKNAIDRLVEEGTTGDGNLAFGDKSKDFPYSHAIAAYALGEAYILTHDARIPAILTKAIGIIVKGQRGDGGWSYSYDTGGSAKPDNSVTCWQIQALKTAHYSGLNLNGVDAALDRSMKFLSNMQGDNGIFGYNKPGEGGGHDMTGGSVFCLLIWNHIKDGAVRDGLKVLKEGPLKQKKAPPKPNYEYGDANLYAWYYNTQACFQAGGYHWTWWNRQFASQVIDHQKPDGSWPPVGKKAKAYEDSKGVDAPVFRTTLCILMLEVYYRYLSTSKSEGVAQ